MLDSSRSQMEIAPALDLFLNPPMTISSVIFLAMSFALMSIWTSDLSVLKFEFADLP